MIRTPAVANRFYPGDEAELSQTVAELLPTDRSGMKKGLAVVVPHAGYIYSGKLAAETFARVEIPPDVILLGPNHHGQGALAAIMQKGHWDMPFGMVRLNEELAGCILRLNPELVKEDESAHRFEHSLEVQVPFLQFLQKDLTLAPLLLSPLSFPQCVALGRGIAAAIKEHGQPTLIVASTDMTHYETRAATAGKDKLAIERIRKLDPAGLYQIVEELNISMCGVIPTTVALVAAIELGARVAELVNYTDSGEISGDLNQVVGYAGFVIA
jgi:MEMO1 family protein